MSCPLVPATISRTQKEDGYGSIGFKFAKKFIDSEKKKNPKLDDAAATEAATPRFLGTMWLMNSDAPPLVTKNLVQAHISVTDNYLKSVERAFAVVSVIKETSGDTGRAATSLAQANEASSGSGARGGRGGGPGRGAGHGGWRQVQPGRTKCCHRCGSRLRFYSECTIDADSCGEEEDIEVADTEVSCNFNCGYDRVVTLAQQGKISLGPNLILLDSCSMCSICNDSTLLHNVQHIKDHGLS